MRFEDSECGVIDAWDRVNWKSMTEVPDPRM